MAKKPSSCLGVFLKASVVTTLVLLNLGAAAAFIAIKFLGHDPAIWLDFSHWYARPYQIIFLALAAGGVLGLILGGASAAVSIAFAEKKNGQKSKPVGRKPARPQSNRRTTL